MSLELVWQPGLGPGLELVWELGLERVWELGLKLVMWEL